MGKRKHGKYANEADFFAMMAAYFKRCRTCTHPKIAHSMGQSHCLECAGRVSKFAGGDASFLKKIGADPAPDPLIMCTEFVPSDNLEYVEWVHDKKERNK